MTELIPAARVGIGAILAGFKAAALLKRLCAPADVTPPLAASAL